MEYVLSCPLRKFSQEEREKILDRDNYSGRKSDEGGSYDEFRYKGRRVVVSYSEKRKRQDQRKREKILDKLRSLEKEEEISTSRLVKNTGMRKYMEKIRGKTRINWKKVEEEARWDGLYGVCTNMERSPLNSFLICIVLFGRLRSCFVSTSILYRCVQFITG